MSYRSGTGTAPRTTRSHDLPTWGLKTVISLANTFAGRSNRWGFHVEVTSENNVHYGPLFGRTKIRRLRWSFTNWIGSDGHIWYSKIGYPGWLQGPRWEDYA